MYTPKKKERREDIYSVHSSKEQSQNKFGSYMYSLQTVNCKKKSLKFKL